MEIRCGVIFLAKPDSKRNPIFLVQEMPQLVLEASKSM